MRPVAILFVAILFVLALTAGCGSGARHPRPVVHSKAYLAAVAYTHCMRARGVAHPLPDRSGDFSLTDKHERAMRKSASPQEREAADKACFHLLRGTVSTKPLSPAARGAALIPLRDLERCLASKGYRVGKPIVKAMSRGRAMFGFDRASPAPSAVQHACEKQVHLAKRIGAIVKLDRAEGG